MVAEDSKKQAKRLEEVTEAKRYAKEVKRKIRLGIYPKFHLVKGKDQRLERIPHHKYKTKTKLTWRQVSTFVALTKES